MMEISKMQEWKKRIYNFSGGPAMLPEPVLLQAQSELLNWNGSGMSMLELGHRTDTFQLFLEETQLKFRKLLAIPENYNVLFFGGAARNQFAMIPLNFVAENEIAAYLISGVWSSMAYSEATKLSDAYCVASSEAANYKLVPEYHEQTLRSNTAYLYYATNETVNGIRFPYVPKSRDFPLIADMTSSLLTEPINIADYALIFAGAQKNIANAGLTVVIIRSDLLEKLPNVVVPTMFDYRVHAKNNSMFATPPIFNCYIASLVFSWMEQQGGISSIYQLNQQKSQKLYDFIDATSFYTNSVDKPARSLTNVCFTLRNPDLELEFIKLAEERGLYGLKGHRFVGGLRASIYNAMPMSGVDALMDFMKYFEEKKSKTS